MGKKFKKIKKGSVRISDLIKARNSMQEELVQAFERAETASRAKSDFLSRVSHEIRTPMNAIIGMTKLAENSNDINKIMDYLIKIDEASEQLRNIINDILDMSEIESNKFELNTEEFNLRMIIDEIIAVTSEKTAEKNIKFNMSIDEEIYRIYTGDGHRLSQVIMNLLDNAVKFTPENGELSLTVKKIVSGLSNTLLEFRVEDTGIGMSKEQQANLFKAFEQADGSISRKYGGMGVGLAICKKIVELMGGNIYAESEPGRGSTFIFTVNLGTVQNENTGHARNDCIENTHVHESDPSVQHENIINKIEPIKPIEIIQIIEITHDFMQPDIDLNEALKKLSNNKKLFVSLMKSFKGEDLYNQLIEARNHNDLKTAATAARALVNTASNLSMPLLSLYAITMENHLKTNGFKGFDSYMGKIRDALEPLSEKIQLCIENM